MLAQTQQWLRGEVAFIRTLAALTLMTISTLLPLGAGVELTDRYVRGVSMFDFLVGVQYETQAGIDAQCTPDDLFIQSMSCTVDIMHHGVSMSVGGKLQLTTHGWMRVGQFTTTPRRLPLV